MLGRPTDSSQVVEEEGQSAQGGGDDDDDTGEEFLPPHQEKAEGAHGGPNLVQLDDFRHSGDTHTNPSKNMDVNPFGSESPRAQRTHP